MTTLESLSLGGFVTVLGIAVVFLALIILIILMKLYPLLFKLIPWYKARVAKSKTDRKLLSAQRKEAKKVTIISVDKPAVQTSQAVPLSSDTALIAVITAAIAASLGTSSNGIIIKSLKRSSVSTPAWGREGRYEQFRY